MNEGMKKLGNK